ncbi:PspC domain-containing protein [Flectobacillus longus]|uniref:PspC domain-containing protein n=1 Tax=Flectobacillus longus TaxID=2984207 RepID=UPI0024B8736D|nr:PspC domain-containing protein [Flectobacillus longus]MDI9878647.1 PspC domain-containing protein [Flectobacillus longus]
MKKTISINIAGIIFHIEEDGYEKLGLYLKAIQSHFASYEGSKEIIEDIESRIAEKFWDKQKRDAKQAITLEDVDELIASMGTVSDFEAIQEEEDLVTEEKAQNTYSSSQSEQKSHTSESYEYPKFESSKKLYRDTQRKLLGGVCAGFAHYLGIDALWVRLIFLITFLGLSPLTESPLSGVIFVLYIASWIAFPANAFLEEDDTVKKFYRNPDHKVLGGVVSGVSSYTGFDLGMLRFVFVLMIFAFGSGIVIYLILWAIAPEAKTITDKMQMTGEPITLENIESNIKRTLNTENKPEDTLTKVLLLPFRMISQVFKALGPIAQFAATAFRFFAGGIMLFTSLAMIVALFFTLFVGFTALESANVYIGDHLPVGFLARDASPFMFLAGFLAALAPSIAVGIVGISLLLRRNIFTSVVWQSLLGIFIVGLFGSMYTGISYAKNFSRSASIQQSSNLDFGKKTPLLTLKHVSDHVEFVPSLEIIGYEGDVYKLEKEYYAKGFDKKDAEKNAGEILYTYSKIDSVLAFDEEYEFTENARFRDQRVRLRLYIPYEKPFSMTREFASFIENRISGGYFDGEKDLFKGSLWQFTREGELVCLNRFPVENNYDNHSDSSDDETDFAPNDFVQKFPLKEFNKVQSAIETPSEIYIHFGENYKVEVGGDQKDVENIVAEVKDGRLIISQKVQSKQAGFLTVHITLPTLLALSLDKGFGNVRIKDIQTENLQLDVKGQYKIRSTGHIGNLTADLGGLTNLEAFDLEIENAKINASENAHVEVDVNQNLEAKASGVAQIRYKGSPNLQKTIKDSGVIKPERD